MYNILDGLASDQDAVSYVLFGAVGNGPDLHSIFLEHNCMSCCSDTGAYTLGRTEVKTTAWRLYRLVQWSRSEPALTSSAGGYSANSSGCRFACRASWFKRSSSSWLLKASSPSTLWSGVKHRRLKSEEVSVRPESSVSPARVGDLTWGKGIMRGMRVVAGLGVE